MTLKPCPFCGKPPILDEHPPSPGDDDSFTVIRCSACGISNEWNYTESAVKWWNTRVVNSHDALVKALEECAAAFKTPPGSVAQCQRAISVEFQRRMDIAGAALSATQPED